jgi:hypothetical protein
LANITMPGELKNDDVAPAGVKSIECPPCFMIDIVQRFGGALRWDGRL